MGADKDKGAMEDAENRIIVISALTLDERTISKMEHEATKDPDTRIHSSFICIRNNQDVNWDRVQNQRERVYGISGCNYFTLNSSEQLRDRLVTRFDETVSPSMLNMSVTVEVPSSDTKCVAAVHRLNLNTENTNTQSNLELIPMNSVKNEILSICTLF